MAAPLKPWERPGVNNFTQNMSLPANSMSSMPLDNDRLSAIGGTSAVPSASPPLVPPRPSQQSSFQNRMNSGLGYGGYGGYSSYSSPYGGMSGGMGGYGGLYNSPYSSYGGYGYGRHNDQGNSSFARHAEESSRPAFESIESIVQAVTSVGMMLDSTFQAVYNSFRAVIGVADNFSRLKSQLFQVFSALAVIRTLKYLCRRVLELLRLKPSGEAEREWKKAFQQAAAAAVGPSDGAPKKSNWPILMFFGIILGGPYLIWRLISSFSGKTDEKRWASGKDDHFVAQALYSFQGQGVDEISFSQGQMINVAPKELQPRVRGWLLASVNGEKTGMIPANYLKILGKKRGTSTSGITQEQQHNPQIASAVQNSEDLTRQAPSLNSDDLESAFSSDKVSIDRNDTFGETFDSRDQEAAEILSEVDKT